ncbi:phosphoenolpyruvate carboxylase [Bdellovibrio sp. HCB117]|uniref:phosphoenolpyruvate carboxylase n=1 Tax=Bdellovibrio sp. HCB117 TaxID=3394359 RepID=UPI0039B6CFCC
MNPEQLPKELTNLVNWSVTELGKVIQSELGEKGFDRIESLRQYVKTEDGGKLHGLLRIKSDLSQLSRQDQYAIAHSFALMLELINSCESAYRTHRLRQDTKIMTEEGHSFGHIIHVLTAHPTESRNPDIIYYFKKIQKLLEKHLVNEEEKDTTELFALLKITWRIPMSKQRKPTVMDEAEYIYSLALHEDVMRVFIEQTAQKLPFYIRSWVGGDKDGHPGVNEKTLLGSLQMARQFLLRWIQDKFSSFMKDLEPLAHTFGKHQSEMEHLLSLAAAIRKLLTQLKKIRAGDSKKVKALQKKLDQLLADYQRFLGIESSVLYEVRLLLKIFPGLVVPLELREEASLVHEALQSPLRKSAISRMLQLLGKIASENDPRFYVRGFVLSQTESAKDLIAGVQLVEKYLGKARLPVIPLFESAHSLSSSVSIVEEFLKNSVRRKYIENLWSKKFEVMLGYSDSAKENGSFPSRFLIYSAIRELEKVIKTHGFEPVFFHGSGGSVERGGGSIQEQTEWWPHSALNTVKMTVQGEMIYRNYSSPEILRSQLDRLESARDLSQRKEDRFESPRARKDLLTLSQFVQQSYQELLKEPAFLQLIETATPYIFLKDLKLGSRPAKRQGSIDIKHLRAIPWVLCWTQTRILFPSWWGIGSFWRNLNEEGKIHYIRAFVESSLFRSYIKLLGFTLEKVELEIFAMYLHSSELPKEVAEQTVQRFTEEYEQCRLAVREITGEESLLWYRPWLETSIALRSPLIHPLNILQLIALKEKDVTLLRETVTGVASGMLTTG